MRLPRTSAWPKTGPAWLKMALVLSVPLLVCACASLAANPPSGAPSHAAAASPKPADLGAYVETLAQMAPGDPARQSAALAAAQASAQQNPTGPNRLRYAIALGSAGHAASNPVEARRLIAELLAGQRDLKPQEIDLANAYLREFDARVALYADIARQQEDFARQLQAASADDERRYAAINAENARLKKALAEAERKLEAVAEMERTLLEKGGTNPPGDRAPKQ